MNTFDLSIISPEGQIYDDKVESVTAPGVLGSFGVLANHAPMVAALQAGIIKVKDQTKEFFFAIDSGVLEVGHDHSVLALIDNVKACDSYEQALSELKK